MTQLLTVTNHATKATDSEVNQWVRGVDYQLQTAFNSSGWVKRGLAPSATVEFFPAGTTPPSDAWNLIVLDNADQSGALGWHDDQAGKPYGEIFVVDSENDGVAPSAVLSHEVLEILGDPWVDPMQPAMVRRPGTNKYYIRELCDACEGGPYNVTLPDGSSATVACFCLPSWWEIQGSTYRPTSNTGYVKNPWEISPQGYMSIYRNGQWSQIYGDRVKHRPDPDAPGAPRDASAIVPRWNARFHRMQTAILQRGVESLRAKLFEPDVPE